jgi:hypothetical protein
MFLKHYINLLNKCTLWLKAVFSIDNIELNTRLEPKMTDCLIAATLSGAMRPATEKS